MIIIAAIKKSLQSRRADVTALGLMSAFLLAYFLKMPRLVSDAASAALEQCAHRLIPAIFPFLVLVGLINSSGLSALVSRALGGLFSAVFGLPSEGAYALLLGSLGGFPIGAICTRSLYKRGVLTTSEAERLCSFSNNAGLAFCVGGIGLALFDDICFGWQLYIAQLLAALLLGAIRRQGSSVRERQAKHIAASEAEARQLGELISSSVSEAGLTMLRICSFAVFFGVIGDAAVRVLTAYFGNIVGALGGALCELSLAGSCCAAVGGDGGRLLCGFAVGFSGLSVHMQVASVLYDSGLSSLRFSLSKLMQGLLTSAILVGFKLAGEFFL